MSPNVALIFLGVASILLLLVGVILFATAVEERECIPQIIGLALAVLAICAAVGAFSLHDFATGKTHYEKLDNPDGTRTWQRIEVSK